MERKKEERIKKGIRWFIKMEDKKQKLMYVGSMNKKYNAYVNYYLALKHIDKNLITFDDRKITLEERRFEMNRLFLDKIRNEKPNIIFISNITDDFDIETFVEIKVIDPKIKTIYFAGDDDCQYDSFTRFYGIFFDYILVSQKKYLYKYKQDGLKGTKFMLLYNEIDFKYEKLKKKYDVVFVGIPEFDRINYIKHLLVNGIKIKIFGRGWEEYKEFKHVYGGVLDYKDYIKVLNQTKIIVNFSKNKYGEPHFKGRVFETACTRTFQLVEYFEDYNEIFKNNELVFFLNKDDLLEKIHFFLDNEKLRNISTRKCEITSRQNGFINKFKRFLNEM